RPSGYRRGNEAQNQICIGSTHRRLRGQGRSRSCGSARQRDSRGFGRRVHSPAPGISDGGFHLCCRDRERYCEPRRRQSTGTVPFRACSSQRDQSKALGPGLKRTLATPFLSRSAASPSRRGGHRPQPPPHTACEAQETRSVMTRLNASSRATTASGPWVEAAGTVARNTFEATTRPARSDTTLAEISTSAVGSEATEMWNARTSVTS